MRRYTDEEIVELLPQSKSAKDLLNKLGMRSGGGNHDRLIKSIQRLGLSRQHWHSHIPDRESNTICSWCNAPIYRSPSKLALSKSGLYFCDKVCKGAAQRIGGIQEIMPAHYGMGESNYRKIAFEAYDHKCNRCDYNLILEVLEVHHRDHNRDNNNVKNLEILCPTCHDEHHFVTKTGKWKIKTALSRLS